MSDTPSLSAFTDSGPEPEQVMDTETDPELTQTLALYLATQQQHREVGERLEALKSRLKAAAAEAFPEGRVTITDAEGPRLRLVRTSSWRIDTKRMKAENAELYVRYAVENSRTELRAV